MTETMKLTKAQLEALEDAERGGFSCSPRYKPALKLVELGLAQMRPIGGGFWCSITDAGLTEMKRRYDV